MPRPVNATEEPPGGINVEKTLASKILDNDSLMRAVAKRNLKIQELKNELKQLLSIKSTCDKEVQTSETPVQTSGIQVQPSEISVQTLGSSNQTSKTPIQTTSKTPLQASEISVQTLGSSNQTSKTPVQASEISVQTLGSSNQTSKTPIQTRSKTPVQTRSKTPVQTRSKTPVQTRSKTPLRTLGIPNQAPKKPVKASETPVERLGIPVQTSELPSIPVVPQKVKKASIFTDFKTPAPPPSVSKSNPKVFKTPKEEVTKKPSSAERNILFLRKRPKKLQRKKIPFLSESSVTSDLSYVNVDCLQKSTNTFYPPTLVVYNDFIACSVKDLQAQSPKSPLLPQNKEEPQKRKTPVSKSRKRNLTPSEEENPMIVKKVKGPMPTEVKTFPILKSKSFLEEMYTEYQSEHKLRSAVLTQRTENMKKSFLRETNANVIRIQMKRLMEPLTEAIFSNITNVLAKSDFAGSHQRILFDCVYSHIRQDRPGSHNNNSLNAVDEDSTKFWNDEDKRLPVLTPKQIKILALFSSLSQTDIHRNILRDFKNYLFFSVFTVGKIYNMKGYVVKNVIRFYLTLLRMTGDEDAVKLFLFDIFFFRFSRNHIFVCILLDVWPEILTWKGFRSSQQEKLGLLDPVVDSVIWMIFNSGPASSLHDSKVFEAQSRLRSECNVTNPRISAAELIRKLVGQVISDPSNKPLLEATTMSLLLISKHKDFRWTHNNITNLLVELLATNKEVQNWTFETVSLISRIYPFDARQELEKVFEGAHKALLNADDPETENVAFKALIRLGHHLQVQICKNLSNWKPTFGLRAENIELAKTFLGTRGSKYANLTILYDKKYKIHNQGQKNSKPKVL